MPTENVLKLIDLEFCCLEAAVEMANEVVAIASGGRQLDPEHEPNFAKAIEKYKATCVAYEDFTGKKFQ